MRLLPTGYCLISASRQGHVIAVSTDGASRNVVWLDGEGNMKRAQHVGERFVHQLAVTPDGECTIVATTLPPGVFVLNRDGKVLWENRKAPVKWGGSQVFVEEPDYFALSPDGRLVVLTTDPQELVAFEVVSSKSSWHLSLASEDQRVWREVERLQFSPDGKFLLALVASYLSEGELMKQVAGKEAIAEEGKIDELRRLDEELRPRLVLLEAETGKVVWERIEFAPSEMVTAPRASQFAKPFTPRADLDTRTLYRFGRRLFDAALSSDARVIAVSDDVGNIVVYDAEGERTAFFPFGFYAAAAPLHIRLNPDGRHLAMWACEGGCEPAGYLTLTNNAPLPLAEENL